MCRKPTKLNSFNLRISVAFNVMVHLLKVEVFWLHSEATANQKFD